MGARPGLFTLSDKARRDGMFNGVLSQLLSDDVNVTEGDPVA